jgi:DNA modification methylase
MAVSFKSSTLGASSGGRSVETHQRNIEAQATPYRKECLKCGAVRQDSQLGLEPTPEEYVANMVDVFRAVRRVLRADGTVWLNLGDSYGTGASGGSVFDNGRTDGRKSYNSNKPRGRIAQPRIPGLKPKDLVGIPWRVAFALQADGWYLRSDIIWSKPNPMPESVTDRPTKAHEYLFLLSKSPRYYYDADAVREPRDPAQIEWREKYADTVARWGQRREVGLGRPGANSGLATQENAAGRNLRSVWSIATQPYPGAHFATFPEALVEPCVKAGTSEKGVCPECGAPWVRESADTPEYAAFKDEQRERRGGMRSSKLETFGLTRGTSNPSVSASRSTTGWRPSCEHIHQVPDARLPTPVPAVVLDPFAGSGTTGRVAQRLGRRAVLIDLSGEYLTQAMTRNADLPLGLETA